MGKLRQIQVNGDHRYTFRTHLTDRYLADVNKYPILTAEQEYELAVRAREGDKEANDTLINSNLRFVISVAKVFTTDVNLFHELINEGNIGLIEASRTFDHTRGFKFISHAIWYIRKNIYAYLANNSKTIRIPVNKFSDVSKIKKIEEALAQQLNRYPSLDELLEKYSEFYEKKYKTKLDDDGLISAIFSSQSLKSLDGDSINSRNNENRRLIDVLYDSNEIDALEEFNDSQLYDIVVKYLTILSEFDREIVEYKFGLFGKPELSFKDIGKILGKSHETIRTRFNKSIRKIKREFKKVENLV